MIVCHRRMRRAVGVAVIGVALTFALAAPPAAASAQTHADLALTTSADVSTPTLDDTVVFTLEVTNNGPDSDPHVVVTDPLPNELSPDWVFASQGSCANGPTVVCDLGEVDAGETALVTLATTQQVAIATAGRRSCHGDGRSRDRTVDLALVRRAL